MKILIVDDSSTMRRIIINILAQIGQNDIIQASDGNEAIEAIKADQIDLVLMDWNMPNMTGIDALKTIRSMGLNMPVIMITTEAEKTRILEAIKCGASNYIIKPFSQDVVIGKVREVMDKIKA